MKSEILGSSYHYTRYTRINRWIIPYASIYGIINTFFILNHMPFTHARSLFSPVRTTANFESNFTFDGLRKWSFDNVAIFSPQTIGNLMRIDKTILIRHYITTVIKQSDLQWTTSIDALRFCPTCLSFGYHSFLHQMFLFEKCPIHNIVLSTNCILCGAKISYELQNLGIPGFSCPKCQNSYWTHVVSREGELFENVLHLSPDIISDFEQIFTWLLKIKNRIVFSPRTRRENFHDLETCGKPYISLKQIYALWNQVEEAPATKLLILPETDLEIHAKVSFGSRATEKPRVFCKWIDCKSRCEDNDYNNVVKWLPWNRKICHLEIGPDLPSIYKSIRKYIHKKYLRNAGIRCTIPSLNTWSLLTVPKICRDCIFGRALFFWRNVWEVNRKNCSRDLIYWENAYVAIDGISDEFAARWVILWLFALECLWTFRQTLFLTREMPDEIKREDVLRGRLAFYFSVEIDSSRKHPTFHYWTKSSNEVPPYNCLPPGMGRRRGAWPHDYLTTKV